jgi:hypothetical protein
MVGSELIVLLSHWVQPTIGGKTARRRLTSHQIISVPFGLLNPTIFERFANNSLTEGLLSYRLEYKFSSKCLDSASSIIGVSI